MRSIKGEDVRGYRIAETFICKDCVDEYEVKGIEREHILIESIMDKGADYICSRCKRRI